MLVDAYASGPHYAAHLRPIYDALAPHRRGHFWTPLSKGRLTGDVTLVASWRDAQKVPGPLIYLEHGAGQTYPGDPRSAGHGSYSGGRGLERVRLFLTPSVTVAERWHATYPDAQVAAVGCPRLDRHHPPAPKSVEPLVAVTFHWDCGLIPETRSAWKHYAPALRPLAEAWPVLGHAHPRIWNRLVKVYDRAGIEATRDLDEVLERADLLVADNTSALYEFASLDRPVVVANSPHYRRDVHHGLRFWDHLPGLSTDGPDELVDAVGLALADPPTARRLRSEAVDHVYAAIDGRATRRAIHAIEELLHV